MYEYRVTWRREGDMTDHEAVECPHDDAGEGDWCYSCWTNIKTGESYFARTGVEDYWSDIDDDEEWPDV